MARNKQIDSLLDQAETIALTIVERMARASLRRGGRAKSFIMCMGGAVFYDLSGKPLHTNHRAYRHINAFLDEYDNYLKLTGTPMRIDSADGPIITDW